MCLVTIVVVLSKKQRLNTKSVFPKSHLHIHKNRLSRDFFDLFKCKSQKYKHHVFSFKSKLEDAAYLTMGVENGILWIELNKKNVVKVVLIVSREQQKKRLHVGTTMIPFCKRVTVTQTIAGRRCVGFCKQLQNSDEK